MSIFILITCDKCGKETDLEVDQGSDISKIAIKDAPRFFSYSELPLGHICFDCAMEILEDDE